MAPRQCVGWGAAGVSGPPHLAWHPRMMPGAAPRSPSPSPASVVVPAPCGISSLLFAKHFGPLLTVPQHQGIRQAVCCFVAAPVDVFEDACQSHLYAPEKILDFGLGLWWVHAESPHHFIPCLTGGDVNSQLIEVGDDVSGRVVVPLMVQCPGGWLPAALYAHHCQQCVQTGH